MADQTLVAITGRGADDALLLFLCAPSSAAWFAQWPEFVLVARDVDLEPRQRVAPVAVAGPLNPPRMGKRKPSRPPWQPWGT